MKHAATLMYLLVSLLSVAATLASLRQNLGPAEPGGPRAAASVAAR